MGHPTWLPKETKRSGPEAKIQDALIDFLRHRSWIVKSTHGNIYQYGFPDLYIAHRSYGVRWIEIKNPDGYRFTGAQLEFFHQLASAGVGVWVLTAATEDEYKKLFSPANWHYFLMNARGL